MNYSKKAMKTHHGEVPVAMQTNIKQVQQKNINYKIATVQTTNNSNKNNNKKKLSRILKQAPDIHNLRSHREANITLIIMYIIIYIHKFKVGILF